MTNLSCDVIRRLKGKTLVTAESCTGGGIGAALTEVPGSSAVFKGGIISYCDEVKHKQLGVAKALLEEKGAVSFEVAQAMAAGARKLLDGDYAISVTGLAGPDGDAYGNPVGTVFIGLAGEENSVVRHFVFAGTRDEIRRQAITAALQMVLDAL